MPHAQLTGVTYNARQSKQNNYEFNIDYVCVRVVSEFTYYYYNLAMIKKAAPESGD